MVLRSKFFSIFGFIVIVLGFIALIIAFSTSNWVASKKSVAPSGFENMGLWVVCFHNFNPAQLLTPVATSKQYEGCLTAISYEMEVIRNHFYPSNVHTFNVALIVLPLIYFCTHLGYFVYLSHESESNPFNRSFGYWTFKELLSINNFVNTSHCFQIKKDN